MTSDEVEAYPDGESVVGLRDWASLWGDLLHVDMVLLARQGLPDDGSHVFARRGLWEAAVVAYGRTAMSGRRQHQVSELLSTLGPDANTCHEEVMAWRNRHAAHRVDRSREMVDIRAIVDPELRCVNRIAIRVAPLAGPEQEDDPLAARFQRHVKTLRDLTWVLRIQPLAVQVLQECRSDIDALLLVAAPPAPASRRFSIGIDPLAPPA